MESGEQSRALAARLADMEAEAKRYRGLLQEMTEACIAAREENARLRRAMSHENDDICQTLGKALGYPWYKDDQGNFPGADESNGVCVGDHVAVSIADEAAKTIARLRDRLPAPGSQYVTVADELVALLIAAPSQPVTLQITELGDGHLQFLAQEVDTRRLREDAERVEWLEALRGEFSIGGPTPRTRNWFVYVADEERDGEGPTLRAAIDAARAQAKEGSDEVR